MLPTFRKISIVVIFITSFTLSAQDSVLNINTRDYDQKHIKLTLSFSIEEGRVNGREEFTFSPMKNNFTKLILHSRTTQVSSVKIKDKSLAFTQNITHIFIDLDKPYKSTDEITLTIDYISHPTRGMYFFYPQEYAPNMPYQIWTQGEGEDNRYWYPAYDLPDDKLTTELIVTVPERFKAISNGVLSSEQESSGNTKTYHWKMDQPHSNYLTTLIVGEYYTVTEKVNGVSLDYNLPLRWKDNAELVYGRVPQMLKFFSSYIVPYPYERYAQTSVQDFVVGGMENVTATTLNMRIHHTRAAIPNYSPDDLLVHEFAHDWFGDYVTCKTWEHIWLNEGFATYFTDLWYENEYGWNRFVYERYSQNNGYFDEVKTELLDKIEPKIKENIPAELSGDKAYDKGAAVLNMLRFELGDEKFNRGIKEYVEKYKNSNVVTEDFRKSMENTTGKNLEQFFNQWVYKAGFPEFDVSYTWNEKDKKVLLTVEQVQKQFPAVGIFNTPILVEVSAGNQINKSKIQITKQKETFELASPQKPDMVSFNKFCWILCTVNFNKMIEELSYQLQYDDDISGRITAAQQLIKFGEDAIPALTKALKRDMFFAVRIEAVESLKKINSEKCLDGIIYAADDEDGRVREAAVKALAIFSKDKVGEFLLSKFKTETNDYVKGAVLYSIGAVKMDNAFEILKEALKLDSHRNIIRRGAFDGFKVLLNPDVLPLVKEYTQYKYSSGGMHLQDTTALACAMLFADTHHDEVIDVVAGILTNPYFRTRNRAAGLLVELKAVSKIPDLEKVLREEKREKVIGTLESAIRKLKEIK